MGSFNTSNNFIDSFSGRLSKSIDFCARNLSEVDCPTNLVVNVKGFAYPLVRFEKSTDVR